MKALVNNLVLEYGIQSPSPPACTSTKGLSCCTPGGMIIVTRRDRKGFSASDLGLSLIEVAVYNRLRV